MLRVVMWSTDPVGKQMAGPGIRYHRLATELAGRFEVTLVAPGEGIPGTPYTFRTAESVRTAASLEADVVVAQNLPLGLIRRLRRAGVRLVFDLYAPALVEAAALLAEQEARDRSRSIRYEEVVATTRVALLLGDAFLCASERQRDHWLGALAALGRVTPEVYADDPTLGSLVAVVPFGIDPAPRTSVPTVKGVLPGIEPSDRLLLWGGGIWNWFDPLTVIRAVGRLAETRSDVKLLFLGLAHPSSAVGEMTMADQAVALASGARARWTLGLLQPSLGAVRRAPRLVRRGRRRGERAPRLARGQAGLPHEVAGPHRLRDAAGRDARATCLPTSSSRGSWAGSSLRATSTAGRRRWPSCSMTIAPTPPRARRSLPRKTELSWTRTGEPLGELIERVASSPRRRSSETGALLRAGATLARSSLERRGFRATVTAASRAVSGGRRR